MKYGIYAIKDSLSGSFGAPFIDVNDDCAKRTFGVKMRDSAICQDLQLFKLGEFSIESGEILSFVEFLANGIEVVTNE